MGAVLMNERIVLCARHHASSAGNDEFRMRGHAAQHLGLTLPERRLAMLTDVFGAGCLQLVFEHVVDIDMLASQEGCQAFSYSGLTAPGHANEDDVLLRCGEAGGDIEDAVHANDLAGVALPGLRRLCGEHGLAAGARDPACLSLERAGGACGVVQPPAHGIPRASACIMRAVRAGLYTMSTRPSSCGNKSSEHGAAGHLGNMPTGVQLTASAASA